MLALYIFSNFRILVLIEAICLKDMKAIFSFKLFYNKTIKNQSVETLLGTKTMFAYNDDNSRKTIKSLLPYF